jgi:Cu/Ag efflux protein CusF
MRSLIAAIAIFMTLTVAAFAAETEGHIKKIDREKATITLDDGKSYKLPGEFDIDSLKEGMDVVIAYDKVGGQNLITDMQMPE